MSAARWGCRPIPGLGYRFSPRLADIGGTRFWRENRRRGILTQLNRGEGRHSLARAVFHGRRGELRQRYREGQEDQPGSLGLVINMIVLWNTLYIEAALAQLRREGSMARDEDAARLSPLIHGHIHVLGRYSFLMPESVAEGGLRPLRDPAQDRD